MYLADVKRAVEDIILRPEENAVANVEGRATLAALDLCQVPIFIDLSLIKTNALLSFSGLKSRQLSIASTFSQAII